MSGEGRTCWKEGCDILGMEVWDKFEGELWGMLRSEG